MNLTPLLANSRIPAGDVVSVLGRVLIRDDSGRKSDEENQSRNAHPGDVVYAGDVINTSSNGGVKLLLRDRSIIDIGASSLFKVGQFSQNQNKKDERQVELSLAYGSVRAAVTEKLKGPSKFKLRTPSAVMGVRGTVAFSEVAMGDQIQSMSGFLSGKGSHQNSAPEGLNESKTTFLITQGQGVVSSVGGVTAGGAGIVLNPGDQATTSALANQSADRSPSSVNSNGGFVKNTLSQAQFEQKVQQVQNLSRSTDTSFVLATNFDRALEQKQTEQKSEQRTDQKSEQKSEQKPEQKSEEKSEQKSEQKPEQKPEQKSEQKPEQKSADTKIKDRGPASQSQTATAALSPPPAGAAPAAPIAASVPRVGSGGVLDMMGSQLTQALPPPIPMTISNLGISGAPTNSQVLNQQSSATALPTGVTKQLTVKVSW